MSAPETRLEQLVILDSARAALSAAARAVREAGYSGTADEIMRRATETRTAPLIVFVGESGRGKSSVVNLLAPQAEQDVSDVPGRGIYRVVRPGTGAGDTGPSWIYPNGLRATTALSGVDPIGVELPYERCLLGAVQLLDTPSSGGLTASQSQLNLKLLETASIAVFVTDAGALLSSAELSYLRECSALIEAVGVVVTKTDLYPQSWQEVVAGNAALLKTQVPRLAESYVIGVSTPMSRSAQSLPDGAAKKSLTEASGLPALVAALDLNLKRAGNAPTANALRHAHSALEVYKQSLLARLSAAQSSPDARNAVLAEKQRLVELKKEGESWTQHLERDLGEIRDTILRLAGTRLDSWAADWTNRIQAAKALRDEKTSQQLTNEIFAGLQTLRADVVAEAEKRLRNAVRGVFREVSLPAVLDELLRAAAHPEHEHKLGSARGEARFDPSLLTSMTTGANMGSAVLRLLTGAGVGVGIQIAPVVAPLAAVAVLGAGAVAVVNQWNRQNMLERNRLLAEIPKLAQTERRVISDYLEARLRSLRPEILVAYQAQLSESIGALKQLISEHERQQQSSAATARKRIQEIQGAIEAIEMHLAAIDGSLKKLKTI